MSEDLISNKFSENINRSIIKRNIRLSNIIFSLVIIYVLVDIYDWYRIVSITRHYRNTSYVVYEYKVRPIIAMVILVISVLTWSWIYKANKLINEAFEKNDADYFNEGYSLFCRSNALIAISYGISILTVSTRLILEF